MCCSIACYYIIQQYVRLSYVYYEACWGGGGGGGVLGGGGKYRFSDIQRKTDLDVVMIKFHVHSLEKNGLCFLFLANKNSSIARHDNY